MTPTASSSVEVCATPKSSRKVKRPCDFALYAERNLVERFFNTIRHYRGITTRYEKTARNLLAGLSAHSLGPNDDRP
jgi:transposase